MSLLAQRPVAVKIPDVSKDKLPLPLKMDCNDAGQVSEFADFQMVSTSFGTNIQSTDVRPFNNRPDTIFLCFDDQFTVDIVPGSEDLSGDPFPATTPGVGFAFYRCAPTVTGPTIQDIRADACVADNGLTPFDALAVGVNATGYATGDYKLIVANDLQGGFTIPGLFPVGGEPTPVVLTLAPITFDDFDDTAFEAVYEGNPIGQCVDVAIDQRFQVAYLNPVNVANLGVDPGIACEGLFDVRGGTPELRGGTGYNITIEETTTGARATILTPSDQIVHNAVIRYRVPAAGTYRISIEDANGCPLENTTITHTDGCPQPVGFTFPYGTGLPGESFCLPVTVDNFTDVVGFQFELGFDPAVLRFDSLNNFSTDLVAGVAFNGPVSSGGTLSEGTVRIVYSDNFAGPSTIPQGGQIFDVCFTIIGDLDDQSPLDFNTGAGTIGVEYTRDSGEIGEPTSRPGAISVTDQAFLVELDPEGEICVDSDDGSIMVRASGTEGPFEFSLRQIMPVLEPGFRPSQTQNTVPATITFPSLEAATYEVRVVDGNGAVVLQEIEVASGLDVNVIVLVNNAPSCAGFDDGEVRADVFANGVLVVDPVAAGYTFAWENSTETSEVLSNLTAGNYEVTVTAPNGICSSTDIGPLGDPDPVTTPTMNIDDATCSGAPDGSIAVGAQGGVGPYDIQWPGALGTDMGVSTSFRDNLLPGDYEVFVTDSEGCADTSVFTLSAEKILDINFTIDSIACFGDANAVINVSGTVTGAPPVGDYFARIVNLATSVVGPEERIVNNDPFPFSGLDTGTYVIVLRDEDPAGCETTDTIRITQPDLLEIDDDLMITNETCTTGMDGTVTAAVAGGTMPYEYRWVNDSLDMPMDTITPGMALTSLSADTNYILIVTDRNGCTDTARFTINAPAAAQLMPIDTSFISCPGDADGQLTVVATPPMGETITSFRWFRVNADGSLGSLVANGATTDDNLPVGVYEVQVITSNSCTIAARGVVVSPGEVFLNGFSANDPQCPGDANGSIFLDPAGGTPNANGTYNYVWSTDPFGAPTQNPAFTNLTAGSYTVTITDANGCLPAFDTTFVLVDPPAITGTFALTPVSCPDDMVMDGSATFTASYSDGTQGTYDFIWPATGGNASGVMMDTEDNLARGPVTVRVTDGVCSESFVDTIRSPDAFEVVLETEPVSCNGLTDGEATAIVTGGTPGYVFDWGAASTDTDNSISNLAASNAYQVQITDMNGCSPAAESFIIREPDPLTLTVDQALSTETVQCAGDANGRINVFISSTNNNDLAMNPYSWSGNVAAADSPLASDLAPGTYSVTVTDVEGCQDSVSYTIGEPEAITFNVLPIEEPLCFGETTPVLIDTAFGGTSNGIEDFSFSVNNDGFRINVGQAGSAFAGEVVVTVFDSVGCSADQTFSVNQPPQIIIDLPEEITVELGDSLTRLNPLISPAGDIYEFLWTPADFLSSDTVRNPLLFPFESRDYTFQVTNMNGCQAFADIFVDVDANRNVYIPNVFSPNRDGRNEDFRIFACQGVRRVNSVQVFDRWGGLLFSKTNFEPNCLDGIKLWEGEGQNGKPVNPGVFVYVVEVEFLDDVKLVYRGDVTVLR
ncbi:Cohesin domain-containing protein [Neolewinella agarilytica]|uniref:Cohesin domain-containing protein n=2 Tax=Neolewinella agarilytica TaxID=478744 RepID=A0A1H9B8E9_9BACT|nr:Cohesin domain-containing protein [Neolewinella agarilytica]